MTKMVAVWRVGETPPPTERDGYVIVHRAPMWLEMVPASTLPRRQRLKMWGEYAWHTRRLWRARTECPFFFGSHGCDRAKGHLGHHRCDCGQSSKGYETFT